MPSVTIIGIGRVGGALDIAFRGSEYRVQMLIRRDSTGKSQLDEIERISTDIVIIATPDGAITNVAASLAGKVAGRPIVLHTSGALSSGELAVLAVAGCPTASMHPLVSISSPEIGAKRFAGAHFCVEGDERGVSAANAIVRSLGGISFQIPAANKALYHASAVTACGHVTALIEMAFSMMNRAGVEPELSVKILSPLIRSTIDNIEEQGTAAALTGTFARADKDGLKRQLASFEGKLSDEELEIFLDLAGLSLKLAKRQGVNDKKVADVNEVISMAKSNLR